MTLSEEVRADNEKFLLCESNFFRNKIDWSSIFETGKSTEILPLILKLPRFLLVKHVFPFGHYYGGGAVSDDIDGGAGHVHQNVDSQN